MSTSLILRGGRVLDPSQGLDGVMDVAFRDGRVAAVGRERMSFSDTPGGGGRSLYWIWPFAPRHFHCAAAGRARVAPARAIERRASRRRMVRW